MRPPVHGPATACGPWHSALGGDIPIRVDADATLTVRPGWGRFCLGIGTTGPDSRRRSAFPALRQAGFLAALLAKLPSSSPPT